MGITRHDTEMHGNNGLSNHRSTEWLYLPICTAYALRLLGKILFVIILPIKASCQSMVYRSVSSLPSNKHQSVIEKDDVCSLYWISHVPHKFEYWSLSLYLLTDSVHFNSQHLSSNHLDLNTLMYDKQLCTNVIMKL